MILHLSHLDLPFPPTSEVRNALSSGDSHLVRLVTTSPVGPVVNVEALVWGQRSRRRPYLASRLQGSLEREEERVVRFLNTSMTTFASVCRAPDASCLTRDGRYAFEAYNRAVVVVDLTASQRAGHFRNRYDVTCMAVLSESPHLAKSTGEVLLALGGPRGVQLHRLALDDDRNDSLTFNSSLEPPVLLAQKFEIKLIEFSPDGKHLLLGTSSGDLGLWRIADLLGASVATSARAKMTIPGCVLVNACFSCTSREDNPPDEGREKNTVLCIATWQKEAVHVASTNEEDFKVTRSQALEETTGRARSTTTTAGLPSPPLAILSSCGHFVVTVSGGTLAVRRREALEVVEFSMSSSRDYLGLVRVAPQLVHEDGVMETCFATLKEGGEFDVYAFATRRPRRENVTGNHPYEIIASSFTGEERATLLKPVVPIPMWSCLLSSPKIDDALECLQTTRVRSAWVVSFGVKLGGRGNVVTVKNDTEIIARFDSNTPLDVSRWASSGSVAVRCRVRLDAAELHGEERDFTLFLFFTQYHSANESTKWRYTPPDDVWMICEM